MVLGEGADKSILEEVIGVASVQEVGFELDGVAEEIGCVCADPAYAQELAIGETLASVERVARLESEVVVGICGFGNRGQSTVCHQIPGEPWCQGRGDGRWKFRR